MMPASASQPFLIDSHAHLELEPLSKDPVAVVSRALEAGVKAIITVGIDLDDARIAVDVAQRFNNVFLSLGFHPHNAKDANDSAMADMERLATHPLVKGYGEIGLDFFRNLSPRDCQIRVFSEQLELAKRLKKPVVIHLRDAYDEGLAMLEKAAPFPERGVIHCFSGDATHAERAMEIGFYISIPGTVTYRKNDKLRDIVRMLPEDRILLETDCPFLAPEPLRGKTNEPAYMVHTARAVALVRGESLEQVASYTSGNAIGLFGLNLDQLDNLNAFLTNS